MLIIMFILAAVVTILVVAIVYYYYFPYRRQVEVVPVPEFIPAKATQKPFATMDTREKIDWIFNTYFGGPDEVEEARKRQEEDAYIDSLPRSIDCEDSFDECPKWANNGECEINPEFMLYACPKSCAACSLREQDRFNLVVIYNSRPVPHAVYHGAPYPSTFPYLRKLYRE